MRIDVVNATAFGPLIGQALELSPGMNVIYGPNESGKSSWHAAIYAALCGVRRSRGQPTREDRAFAVRHRPWRGTTWRVTALVTLDDGSIIEIEQGFGSGGRARPQTRPPRSSLRASWPAMERWTQRLCSASPGRRRLQRCSFGKPTS